MIPVCEAPGCDASATYAAFSLFPDDAPPVLLCDEHAPALEHDSTLRGIG